MKENEVWVNIKGYETAYQLSNLGAVRRIDKSIPNRKVTPYENEKGYLKVGLSINGKRKMFKVHRLVASHFVANIDGYNEVNHRDCNKLNNSSENLEWCTRKQNMQHASRNNLIKIRIGKDNRASRPVIQYDLIGNFIKQWECMSSAEISLGVSSSHICGVCKGNRRTAGGFIWRYAAN